MQRISSLIAHRPVCVAERARRLLAVVAAFGLPGDGPMQPLDLLQPPLEGLRIGNKRAIREGGKRLDANSTPTTGPVLPRTTCSCSTWRLTYQGPACSETVADRILT